MTHVHVSDMYYMYYAYLVGGGSGEPRLVGAGTPPARLPPRRAMTALPSAQSRPAPAGAQLRRGPSPAPCRLQVLWEAPISITTITTSNPWSPILGVQSLDPSTSIPLHDGVHPLHHFPSPSPPPFRVAHHQHHHQHHHHHLLHPWRWWTPPRPLHHHLPSPPPPPFRVAHHHHHHHLPSPPPPPPPWGVLLLRAPRLACSTPVGHVRGPRSRLTPPESLLTQARVHHRQKIFYMDCF